MEMPKEVWIPPCDIGQGEGRWYTTHLPDDVKYVPFSALSTLTRENETLRETNVQLAKENDRISRRLERATCLLNRTLPWVSRWDDLLPDVVKFLEAK